MNEQITQTAITVECYGVLAALCGGQRRVNVTQTPIAVCQVLAALTDQVPELAAHLPNTACAVGEHIVGRDEPLDDGQTLVLIPPVSGG